MSWEVKGRCRFYTRTLRRSGRFVRQYLGTGPVAELAAAADELRRGRQRAQGQARKAEQARWQQALLPLQQLTGGADLLARAALVLSGYHQHARGAYRRHRNVRNQTGDAGH
jgi:hypothetical protein